MLQSGTDPNTATYFGYVSGITDLTSADFNGSVSLFRRVNYEVPLPTDLQTGESKATELTAFVDRTVADGQRDVLNLGSVTDLRFYVRGTTTYLVADGFEDPEYAKFYGKVETGSTPLSADDFSKPVTLRRVFYDDLLSKGSGNQNSATALGDDYVFTASSSGTFVVSGFLQTQDYVYVPDVPVYRLRLAKTNNDADYTLRVLSADGRATLSSLVFAGLGNGTAPTIIGGGVLFETHHFSHRHSCRCRNIGR